MGLACCFMRAVSVLYEDDQNGIGSSGRPGYDDGQCQHVAG